MRDQTIIVGNALPWRDKVAFSELMLSWELRSWHLAVDSKHPYFFDRGIPDITGYLTTCDIPIPKHIEKAISLFRYARTVFIAPPWKGIFIQYAERKQSYRESVKTFDAMVECYNRYKYELIELPRTRVEERAEFILSSLDNRI
ncbi:AAA family ATPase [Rosenbergiella australiborealis]|uniref:AAA family ATPase n=1 Tax=Rosenbergiella australiborealis TaxID=1544696 RepID=UPI003B8A7751